MKSLSSLIIVFSLFINVVRAEPLTVEDYKQVEKYIIKSATNWAKTVVTGDKTQRKIYFAEDFVGTGTDGARYGKADVIKETGPSKVYISNDINNINVTFFGKTAVAHGDETWVKKDGSTGRWVWTDIWVQRNGNWQLVAAQDVDAPVTKK